MIITRETVANAISSMFSDHQTQLEHIFNVIEFHKTFQVETNIPLYAEMINEEIEEFLIELYQEGITPNLLKEYCDVAYVGEGLLSFINDEKFVLGGPIAEKLIKNLGVIKSLIAPVGNVFSEDEIYRGVMEVHRSNMSKLDSNGAIVRREDGKVMKSDNYSDADMESIVNVQDILDELIGEEV